jgi:hypothetical protein
MHSESGLMNPNDESKSINRRVRILTILDGADYAGISPLSAQRLHLLAYLTNALAPIWDLEPLTPELLRLYGAPYDAQLQGELDALVVSGLVTASGLSYYQDDSANWRVTASYSLNRATAESILRELEFLPDEAEAARVASEICLAVSALPDDFVERAMSLDVAYSSNGSSTNSLLSLYDADGRNQSSRAAGRFEQLAPAGHSLSPSEQVNLYIRHLYRMARSA